MNKEAFAEIKLVLICPLTSMVAGTDLKQHEARVSMKLKLTTHPISQDNSPMHQQSQNLISA